MNTRMALPTFAKCTGFRFEMGSVLFFLLLTLCSLPFRVSAQTVLINGSTPWYFTSQGTAGTTAGGSMTNDTSAGSVAWTPGTGSGSYNTMIWTYFPSTTLAVGDTLTFNFTLTTGSTNAQIGQSFRMGLFNSNTGGSYTPSGNQSGTLANAAWNDDTGVATFIGIGSGQTTLIENRTTSNTSLWASGAYTPTGSTNSTYASLAANTSYNVTYSLELLSTGTSVTITLGGFTYTYLDTSLTTTTFNELSLFSGSALTGNAYTLTNLDLTYTSAVPEPSCLLLLSSGVGLVAMGWTRRRRQFTA